MLFPKATLAHIPAGTKLRKVSSHQDPVSSLNRGAGVYAHYYSWSSMDTKVRLYPQRWGLSLSGGGWGGDLGGKIDGGFKN